VSLDNIYNIQDDFCYLSWAGVAGQVFLGMR